GRCAWIVVDRRQESTEQRTDLKNREIAPGYEIAGARKGPALVRDVRAELEMARNGGERRKLCLLQGAGHRGAEGVRAGTRLAARLASAFRPRGTEVHQAVGAGDSKVLSQHPIEDRIDRRVGADAEAERERGDGGHERRAREGPKGKLEVTHVDPRGGSAG